MNAIKIHIMETMTGWPILELRDAKIVPRIGEVWVRGDGAIYKIAGIHWLSFVEPECRVWVTKK